VDEIQWRTTTDPAAMLAFIVPKADERKLRLYACACCRTIWHLIVDPRSQRAVEVAELYADGSALPKDMERAMSEASAALVELEDVAYGEGQDFISENHRLAIRGAEAALGVFFDHPVSAWRLSRVVHPDVESKTGQVNILHDLFGNPLRPVVIDPNWRTQTVVSLARAIYQDQAYDRLPILADALEDSGCDQAEVLNHCRRQKGHFRGCWLLDALLAGSRDMSLSVETPSVETPSVEKPSVETAVQSPVQQEPRPRNRTEWAARRVSLEHSRTQQTRRRTRRRWTHVAILLACLGGMSAGLALTCIGVREFRLSSFSEQLPRATTCADLKEHGPNGNVYLTLTDFIPRTEGQAISTPPDDSRTWTGVWVPLAPASAKEPLGKDVCVIVWLDNVRKQDDVNARFASGKLTGCLEGKVEPGDKDRKNLERGNLGIDIDSCWYFREGKHPEPILHGAILLIGGVLLFGLAIVLGTHVISQSPLDPTSFPVVFISLLLHACCLGRLQPKLTKNPLRLTAACGGMIGVVGSLCLVVGGMFSAQVWSLAMAILGSLLLDYGFGMALAALYLWLPWVNRETYRLLEAEDAVRKIPPTGTVPGWQDPRAVGEDRLWLPAELPEALPQQPPRRWPH
jgi:hypothetical protein